LLVACPRGHWPRRAAFSASVVFDSSSDCCLQLQLQPQRRIAFRFYFASMPRRAHLRMRKRGNLYASIGSSCFALKTPPGAVFPLIAALGCHAR
jgi:hypothetical protein